MRWRACLTKTTSAAPCLLFLCSCTTNAVQPTTGPQTRHEARAFPPVRAPERRHAERASRPETPREALRCAEVSDEMLERGVPARVETRRAPQPALQVSGSLESEGGTWSFSPQTRPLRVAEATATRLLGARPEDAPVRVQALRAGSIVHSMALPRLGHRGDMVVEEYGAPPADGTSRYGPTFVSLAQGADHIRVLVGAQEAWSSAVPDQPPQLDVRVVDMEPEHVVFRIHSASMPSWARSADVHLDVARDGSAVQVSIVRTDDHCWQLAYWPQDAPKVLEVRTLWHDLRAQWGETSRGPPERVSD